MLTDIIFALMLSVIYLGFGGIVGYSTMHDSGKFDSLSKDARNALVFGAAFMWPAIIMVVVLWLLRHTPRFLLSRACALGRGVRDLWRAVLPARPPKPPEVVLPMATIVRDGAHVMVGTARPLAETFTPSGHERCHEPGNACNTCGGGWQ